MIEQIVNILVPSLVTSLITALLVFLSLRWVLPKIGAELSAAISPLTHIGAKMAGEASGKSRANKAMVNSMASDMLNSPKMIGIKMAAKQFGFDIDGMIEEHGAIETMQGLTQILGMLGIDVTSFLGGDIGLSGKKQLARLGQI